MVPDAECCSATLLMEEFDEAHYRYYSRCKVTTRDNSPLTSKTRPRFRDEHLKLAPLP